MFGKHINDVITWLLLVSTLLVGGGGATPFLLFKEFWGQFHHHFMSNFYVRRSQKFKKDSQIKQLFALLGPACVKAAHKHVDEIDT